MKATGIVRRIDDLGRVVIPKEIRRTMRIREGDPLEIFTNADGEVIFKKYSPMAELGAFAGEYCDVLAKTGNLPAIVTDKDYVIAAAGTPKKELLERRISPELEEIMETRQAYAYSPEEGKRIQPVEGIEKTAVLAAPILSAGDIVGSVLFLSPDASYAPTDADRKLLMAASMFLGKHMES